MAVEKPVAGQPDIAPKETTTPPEPKSKRIPKNGIVKPEDLGAIADAFLSYSFPEEAQQVNSDSKYGQKNTKTGKFEVSGYRSQYIINAINEIIGPGNWREYGTEEVEKPATAYTTIYRGTFEIGNWKNVPAVRKITHPDGTIEEITHYNTYFEVLAQFHQTGGSRNMDKWESIKGARTNFLKKVCSYISNGWRAYALVMDEDFQSLPPEDTKKTLPEKPVPGARPTPPAEAGKPPVAPATANATLITPEEAQEIKGLFAFLGYSSAEIPERVKALETRYGKTLAEFTQGEARDTIKKMQAQVHKKQEERTGFSAGEQQDHLSAVAERQRKENEAAEKAAIDRVAFEQQEVLGATSFDDTVEI